MAVLVWTDGKQYDVPDDKLAQARKDGFRDLTPDEARLAEAADHPIRAGLEGFERGMTLSASDWALKKVSEYAGVDPRNIEARKEANPLASGGGEVAGMVVPALVPGLGEVTGPALVGKLGAGVSRLVGGGVKGAIARGVAEGGLFGLSSVVDESILEDKPLTAESIAAHVIPGMVFGGGLGLVGEGFSAGLNLASKKLGGVALQDELDKLGNEAIQGQLFSKSQIKKRGVAGSLDDLVDFGREEGLITSKTTHESGFEATQEYLKKLGPDFEKAMGALDQQMPLGPLGARGRDQFSKAVLDRFEQAMQDEANSALKAPIVQQRINELEQQLTNPNTTWDDLWKMQADWRNKLPQNTTVAPKVDVQVNDAARSALRNVVIDASRAALKDDLLSEAATKYFKASRLSAAFEDQMQAGIGRGVGFKEMLPAAALLASGHPVMAVSSGLISPFVRNRGGYIMGSALKDLAENGTFMKVAQALQNRVSQVLSVAPGTLGAWRFPLEKALAEGPAQLLQVHTQLASSAQGGDYLSRLGMSHEDEGMVRATGEKLAGMNAAQNVARAYGDRLERSIDGFFGSKPGPPPKEKALTRADFEKVIANLKAQTGQPDNFATWVPKHIANAAPTVSGMASNVAANAAQFLLSKAPKNPYEAMPVGIQRPWSPSDADIARWNRYAQVVADPGKYLEMISRGGATKEGTEALQAVYPAMFEDIKRRMFERIANFKAPLSYDKRATLTYLFGTQALGVQPQAAQAVQQMHQQNAAMNGPTQLPRGAGVDGRMQVNQQKNLMTQAQRLEGRGS